MAETALLDNDVVLKACCYDLDGQAVAALSGWGLAPAMLAAARFVIASRISKSRSISDRATASAAFARALQAIGPIEPTDAEIAFAAALEQQAQASGLELDVGESQLVSILLSRDLPLLLTGDKRAVAAIEALVGDQFAAPAVAALEQLFVELLGELDAGALRRNICREPKVDRSLTICFGCASVAVAIGDIYDGLRSYIANLRSVAPRVLLASDDLSAVVP